MNIYEENVLAGAILANDESLKCIVNEIGSLIEANPFFERIWTLLGDQSLATKPVRNKVGELSAPNCIGTAFFVAGVGAFNYPYHAYDFELAPHMKQPEEPSKSLADHFRIRRARMVPGAFCFAYHPGAESWHAGIYLGEVREENIVFAQHGHGGNFCPELVAKHYFNPDYYIPRTLLVSSQKPGG